MISGAPNFTFDEFESKDGQVIPEDLRINVVILAGYLQTLRDHLGSPIVINSGYRSPAHNAAEGGVPNSQHLYGKAADISVIGYSPKETYDAIIELINRGEIYDGGVGLYSWGVHYDIGDKGRRWDNRQSNEDKEVNNASVDSWVNVPIILAVLGGFALFAGITGKRINIF